MPRGSGDVGSTRIFQPAFRSKAAFSMIRAIKSYLSTGTSSKVSTVIRPRLQKERSVLVLSTTQNVL